MCTNLGERPSQTTQGGKGETIVAEGKEGQMKYIEGRWDKARRAMQHRNENLKSQEGTCEL